MKCLPLLLVIYLASCNAGNEPGETKTKTETVTTDTNVSGKQTVDTADTVIIQKDTTASSPQVYSNKRFKDVTVERTGEHQFLVKGKGQIFEASFSWVVEDGHEELKQGFEMTDAGAPEWGNFKFSIDVPKKRPNSTLHLILFELSAKDGSRQYELPIPLY